MRKRAQIKSKSTYEEPKRTQQPTVVKKGKKRFMAFEKKHLIAIILVCIFLVVIFSNTYFNYSSGISYNENGEGLEKYLLSGPDPYYNMRLVEGTYETGRYPYYTQDDPLLNYPIGARGGRGPLFNMMALGFSRVLAPFMEEVDAIGLSMQFIPALFGALLIFVIYFLAKELFNEKVGIIAAMLVAIIPIHLGSGHGSAFGLYDHDSFNLLLFFLTFLFLVKSIKEKDSTKSMYYALIAGIPLAALSMTWVEAQFLYVVISMYAIIQMFIDIFTSKVSFKFFRNIAIILWTGYLVSLPVIASQPGGFNTNLTLYLCIGVSAFGLVYYFLNYKKIPWTLSIPGIFIIVAIGLVFLYFVDDLAQTYTFLAPLERIAVIIFGSGIYGNNVSQTIAEANTSTISNTVMSYGPALYWLGWAGFLYLLFRFYKEKLRREYLFIISLFILNIWLAGTAGRFLNDMVPLIALLGGWVLFLFVDWLDYKQMIRNIRSAGGGLHGLRRGIKALHVFGILFIAFLVILPSSFVAFDAAVPDKVFQDEDETWTNTKAEYFGTNHRGPFGLRINKEVYWSAAFNWLAKQDTDIKKAENRPAFISWWDYGFYAVALGGHPTVADNFQDGIPTAANFHTSTSEQDATIVFIIRLLEGDVNFNEGKITDDVREVLEYRVGLNNSEKLISWVEMPKTAPSYGKPINLEYDKDVEVSEEYFVGKQYPRNAVYHDAITLLTNTTIDPKTNESTGVSEEDLIWLYHDLQEVTGWSIRYYGVEGYDENIFNIFGFLADKSLLLQGHPEDEFIQITYNIYEIDLQTGERISEPREVTLEELNNLDDDTKQRTRISGTNQNLKDTYFGTMFYKTYYGIPGEDSDGDGYKEASKYQLPCYDMKHFYAEYISNISDIHQQYNYNGKAAVVIAKYYEGALINGSVLYKGTSLKSEDSNTEIVVLKNLTYYADTQVPIQHDSDSMATDGEFNLIAGAGAYLQIRSRIQIDQEGRELTFIYRNITFDGESNTEFGPITDDDAMRKTDNFERYLNITIEPTTVEGIVYDDVNNNGVYNASTDTLFTNATVKIYDAYGNEIKSIQTNDNGFYNFSDLLPNFYLMRVLVDDFIINETFTDLPIGGKVIDFTKADSSGLEGKVTYTEAGETTDITDATVDLTYIRYSPKLDQATGEQIIEKEIPVGSTTTDSIGNYSFAQTLHPGSYRINVSSSEEPPVYSKEQIIQITPGEIKKQNISIDLTPVEVSGRVSFSDQPISDLLIEFKNDLTVENNTAINPAEEVKTDQAGDYSVDLRPGDYNVTISYSETETLVYSYEDKISLAKGQGEFSYDIAVEKHSVSYQGYTSRSDGTSQNETTIYFFEDESVDNNTAIYTTSSTSEDEFYQVELAPGDYNVSAESKIYTDGPTNYSYKWEGKLKVEESDIPTLVQYNIEDMEKILAPDE
jgi:dolichyl-diphosphooligosaccharide--protein glycosyltransferase